MYMHFKMPHRYQVYQKGIKSTKYCKFKSPLSCDVNEHNPEIIHYVNQRIDLHLVHLINEKKYQCLDSPENHSVVLFRAMSTTIASGSHF